MFPGEFFRGFFKSFLDFVFPPICLSCKRPLLEDERHICRSCWTSVPLLNDNHPLYVQALERLLDSESVSGLVSPFVFEKNGVIQDLIHALKYEGFTSVGTLLGREIGRRLAGLHIDFLVPVPLHRVKQRERGFNQAECIAAGISQVTGIPVRTDVLRRIRYTRTQTRLDMEQRRRNVSEAFALSDAQGNGEGKTCLIVDDVMTTGATIIACAEALQKGGFATIVAASVALAE